MAEEKLVNLSLRRLLKNVPRDKRRGRSVHILKDFLKKKSDKVKIDTKLSQRLWSVGSKGTTGKIRIRIKKQDDGTTLAELVE